MPLTTFANDVAFLARFGPVRVLESPGGGRVAVSAQYQGRVMTSAVDADGQSLGFINRKFIEERNRYEAENKKRREEYEKQLAEYEKKHGKRKKAAQ